MMIPMKQLKNPKEDKMKTGSFEIDESKRGDLIAKFQIQKLSNDPFEPSLKLDKFQDSLEKFHAVRLNTNAGLFWY
jgi:hypothetical protein